MKYGYWSCKLLPPAPFWYDGHKFSRAVLTADEAPYSLAHWLVPKRSDRRLTQWNILMVLTNLKFKFSEKAIYWSCKLLPPAPFWYDGHKFSRAVLTADEAPYSLAHWLVPKRSDRRLTQWNILMVLTNLKFRFSKKATKIWIIGSGQTADEVPYMLAHWLVLKRSDRRLIQLKLLMLLKVQVSWEGHKI